MKILMDTHTFIWWDSQQSKLSPKALELCKNPCNTLILSVASIWEMQIKMQLGKLTNQLPLVEIIKTQQDENHLEILPVTLPHVLALGNLCKSPESCFAQLLCKIATDE